MVCAAGTCTAADRRHDDGLVLLTSCAVVKLAGWLILIVAS